MEEYKKRIVKAIRYIDDHLDTELTLEKISETAAYSPFHFTGFSDGLPAKHCSIILSEEDLKKGLFIWL
ncbi:hypothetical protein MKJ01_03595 [Chryseobacterium sp. SSA4.19]|uniref:hypothetical protein n=1 Tax=Chryseobacterium sp. SSA4.19 TaxID=2919915 RepID=UPI001F4EC7FB|nr:hypothetical protein [Chryseobacterium sp. SSA4.19]MCJ8152847.1 hypothetical protein [Chryseobacterium sp. SSA4.19]